MTTKPTTPTAATTTTAATTMFGVPPLTLTDTPSILEINLRRLLSKCDTKIQTTDRILQGMERVKFLQNLKTLTEMLVDLETECGDKADKTVLQEYERKLESFTMMVDDQKLYTPINKSLSQTRTITTHTIQSQAEKNRENETKLRMTRLAEKEMRRELARGPDIKGKGKSTGWSDSNSNNNNNTSSEIRDRRRSMRDMTSFRSLEYENGNSYSQQPFGLGLTNHNSDNNSNTFDAGQTERALQNDRAQRQEMEADLSRLMQQMRHHAMAMNETLNHERESGLLDDAELSLDNNLAKLKKEKGRLDLYAKQSRKTTWMIWGIVLGVCVVFIFVFFVIRIF